MKIGFDISQISYSGGVAIYTDQLTKHLIKNKDLNFSFFYSGLRNNYAGSLPNVKKFKIPNSILEKLFNQYRVISIDQFIGESDIYHSSDWTQPRTSALKVTTYHDLIPLKYPSWSHPKIVEVHKRRLKLVEREIDIVIAVSEQTKKDLLELSNIPEKKIVVIYEGTNQIMGIKSKEEIEMFRKKYNLPEQFVLVSGGVGERKNIKRIKQAASRYNIIITGETIPWVSDDELPLLYSCATVLLYPSLYEGFGLPVLDAFACGVPVITSITSSLPEVGGKAAIYVDPLNIAEMKEKLDNIMKDEDLRKEYIKKGFDQAKKFSWEKCSYETTQVYQKLYQK